MWLIYNFLKRTTCKECLFNEFTLNQNENCEKCVEGGLCLNGILLNKKGEIQINR